MRQESISADLPNALTSLVGRDEDIDASLAILHEEATRLLTLTGPGGVGKTRLAHEVARRAEADFADGVLVVSLAPIRDADQILPTFARALVVPRAGGVTAHEQVVAALRSRHILLLLDNLEHLLTEPPIWLVDLLKRCTRLKVLATSQWSLNISGEHRYTVSPLRVPSPGDADAAKVAAVVLFLDRARAVRSDFQPSEIDYEHIAEICRRLDGLPLAIELAAAQVSVFRPGEILSRLTDRFTLLQGGARDAPPRLQSMRDAISWSYDLLSQEEQRLFRYLSILDGTFSFALAEHIGNGSRMDVTGVVVSLVDKSLLHVAHESAGDTRLLMLESMRGFGWERLTADGEEPAARDLQAEWCLALVEHVDPYELVSQLAWLDSLDLEHAHLRSSMHWLWSSGRLAELSRLATQLRWFWFFKGREAEGLGWLERILHLHEAESGRAPIDVVLFAGQFAVACLQDTAVQHLQQALAMADETGDVLRKAEATFYLAAWAELNGAYDEARSRYLAARELYAELRNDWRSVVVTYHLGVLAYADGELDRASTTFEEVRSLARAVNDRIIPLVSGAFLALIASEQGNMARAIGMIREQCDHILRVGHNDIQITANTAGVIACACGDYAIAARMFGAAARTGPRPQLPESTAFERAMREAKEALGDDAYERAWLEGHRLTTDQLVDLIDGLQSPDSSRIVVPRLATRLSPRELEVLRHLADGMSNQQIADSLFISRKTVNNHVASILDKLEVESRTAAASFAIRNQLA